MAKRVWVGDRYVDLPQRRNAKVADLEKQIWKTVAVLDADGLHEIGDIFAFLTASIEAAELKAIELQAKEGTPSA